MSVRNLDVFFRATRVAVLGAATRPAQQQMLANMLASVTRLVQARRAEELASVHAQQPELLVVFSAALLTPQVVERLAGGGCRGVIWASLELVPEPVLRVMRKSTMRLLGRRSVGAARPGGANATALVPALAAGKLALIAQSGSVAAAAIDWGAGRSIGFSWVATTGAEADVDVADLLDYAALDPHTRAVVLQVGSVLSPRKFMSAARSCARAKPVVVLQGLAEGRDGLPGADPVRSVAFERAGLIECETLDGLFDALAALDRLPPSAQTRVLVLGNGAGVCALGTDAVLRYGLEPARISAATLEQMHSLQPQVRALGGAMDLGPTAPETLVAVIKAALADGAVDFALLMHSPYAGQEHAALAEAMIHAAPGPRLVTVLLGLKTATAVRRRCAEAGLATFVSGGQAARALRYHLLHSRTQQLLMQTPPPMAMQAADRNAAVQAVGQALAAKQTELRGSAADAVLACYGLKLAVLPAMQRQLQVQLLRHSELGMYLQIHAQAAGLRTPLVRCFPPLDGLLAQRALEGLGLELSTALRQSLAQTLIAVAQLALDLAAVESAVMALSFSDDGGVALLPGAVLTLDASKRGGERQRLALAPYPAALEHIAKLKSARQFVVRPVRPEDEPALIRLLERLDPEEIRMRFFQTLRQFTHAMGARLTQIDYDREFTLVVFAAGQGQGEMIAMAQLISDADGADAEFSVLVHHDYTGLGLGRHLMQQLLTYAKAHEVALVHGFVLRENRAMLGLAAALGFSAVPDTDDASCMRLSIAAAAFKSPVR